MRRAAWHLHHVNKWRIGDYGEGDERVKRTTITDVLSVLKLSNAYFSSFSEASCGSATSTT